MAGIFVFLPGSRINSPDYQGWVVGESSWGVERDQPESDGWSSWIRQ